MRPGDVRPRARRRLAPLATHGLALSSGGRSELLFSRRGSLDRLVWPRGADRKERVALMDQISKRLAWPENRAQ